LSVFLDQKWRLDRFTPAKPIPPSSAGISFLKGYRPLLAPQRFRGYVSR
jgi:hypothetical protein